MEEQRNMGGGEGAWQPLGGWIVLPLESGPVGSFRPGVKKFDYPPEV